MIIPKQIFQTHKNKYIVKDHITTWITQKNYKYTFFDDTKLETYMKNYSDKAYLAFNSVLAPAVKTDLWRYIILYENGGIYADSDIKLIENLDDFIYENDELLVVYDDIRPHSNVFQGFIACKKHHLALKEAIDVTIENILERRYEREGCIPHNVFMISGPSMFGNITNKIQM